MILRKRITSAIYHRLGTEWGGSPNPPGDNLALDIPMKGAGSKDDRYVIRTSNDGHELWLGWPHEWWGFYSAKDARRIAWFVLWDWWALSTWFGLRRRLWYWSLRVRLDRAASDHG